jgi:glycosyltransferase involved in cell wall biosynthesis
MILSKKSFKMDKTIKVSVLMSVYNTDFSLVKRAIDSVLKQDFQNFELIVVDDGSENDVENKILTYTKVFENKITYVRHANCGQAHSINKAVLLSQGEYITIIDGDDEYKPNHLSSCLKEVRFMDLIASTTDTVVETEADYYVPDRFDLNQMVHVDDCILFATLFGKKDVFKNLKFNDDYAADADFYWHASQKYIVRKVDLRTYIYYRNIPNSITAQVKQKKLAVNA